MLFPPARESTVNLKWIPACAGVTNSVASKYSSRLRLLALLLVTLLIAGCSGTADPEPLVFGDVPWTDGERSVYRVVDINDSFAGTMTYEIEAGGEIVGSDGWTIRRVLDTQGDAEELVVEIRARGLRPSYSLLDRVDGGLRQTVEAEYDGSQVDLRIIADPQMDTYERIQVLSSVLDDRTLPMLIRALPLETGYATRIDTFRPVTGNQDAVSLVVRGVEPLDTVLGTVDAWQVQLDFGEVEQDIWISQQAPFPVLRIEDGFTRGVFELQEFEAGS